MPPPESAGSGGIEVRLDELLAARGMTLTELSHRVQVTLPNLSILKNGRAKAIRFSTLVRLCEVLDCQPGDLLRYHAPRHRNDPSGHGIADGAAGRRFSP